MQHNNLKHSLLFTCASLAFYSAACVAQAQDAKLPSVEIHLEVLRSLSAAPLSAPSAAPVAATPSPIAAAAPQVDKGGPHEHVAAAQPFTPPPLRPDTKAPESKKVALATPAKHPAAHSVTLASNEETASAAPKEKHTHKKAKEKKHVAHTASPSKTKTASAKPIEESQEAKSVPPALPSLAQDAPPPAIAAEVNNAPAPPKTVPAASAMAPMSLPTPTAPQTHAAAEPVPTMKPAIVPPAPVIAKAAPTAPAPAKKGFFASMSSFFGGGSKAPAPQKPAQPAATMANITPPAPPQPPAPPAPTIVAKATPPAPPAPPTAALATLPEPAGPAKADPAPPSLPTPPESITKESASAPELPAPATVASSESAKPGASLLMNADSAAAPSLPQLPSKDGAAPPPLPAASEGETAVALAELPASPAENATKKAPEPQMAANDAPLVPALPTPPASAPLAPAAPVATPAAVSPTPSAAHGPAPALRILFSETETDIPLTINAQLDALAHTLTSNPTSRITIMAYASGPEQSGIYPKRVALARGIAVRNYLTTNKGIDIERVNVKAMGNKNDEGGPADRVDVFVLK